jgi:hypothetical protein
MCLFSFRGGEYPKDGYMAVGSFLFLKEQIKGIIIIGGREWPHIGLQTMLEEGAKNQN